MTKVLILKKTRHGSKAEPILKTDALELVKKGLAIKDVNGIYVYTDKQEVAETKVEAAPKAKKKTYKTKVLTAED